MKYFIWIFSLIMVGGCRTKKVQISKEETRQKEARQSAKDSVFTQLNQLKTVEVSFGQAQQLELELISDKDSLGNSKDLIFETEALPNGQKYTVRGGSLRLRTERKTEQKASFKDSLKVNETQLKTQSNEEKTIEKKSFNKAKEVKANGFSCGVYLWLLVVVVLLVVAWRLKWFAKVRSLLNF